LLPGRCRFVRPYLHANAREPHHCAYVDAPFGDGELRVDCADHVPLRSEDAGGRLARVSRRERRTPIERGDAMSTSTVPGYI
jgi:hypothetical protein